MSYGEWPFGRVSEAVASANALQIAQWDFSPYAEEPLVARELKRYFLLRRTLGRQITMDSKVLDYAWHAFIIDTRRYVLFCEQVFGEYLHHESAHYPVDTALPKLYAEMFGEAMPELWFANESSAISHSGDIPLYETGNCA